jgi:hypothetical protein
MTSWNPCKFFKDSNCLIKRSYCDLNCDQTINDSDIRFLDLSSTFAQLGIGGRTEANSSGAKLIKDKE